MTTLEKTFTRDQMIADLVNWEKDFYETSLIGNGYGYKEMIQAMQFHNQYPSLEEYLESRRNYFTSMTDEDLLFQHKSILDGLYED